jgi:hypothetical protein
MKLNRAVVLTLLLGGMMLPGTANAAAVLSRDETSRVVAIRNLKIDETGVTGELVNSSSRPVRDVQLLIRHTWLWKNEFRPKDDGLSEAVYVTVTGEIQPGGSIPIVYKPSKPLDPQPDGRFETSVSIAGYTEVIR